MRGRHATKLGASKIEREGARLVTGVPALVATLFNLKEGDHLVWYLTRSGVRIEIIRAEEGAPEDEGVLGLLR